MSQSTNYILTLTLLDRTQSTRTPISQTASSSQVAISASNGNINSWFMRLEYENTGTQKINNASLMLKMDKLGTFFRSNPILFNQISKSNYLIELTISQYINGAMYTGKTFRGEIGEVQVQEDEEMGEILTIPLRDIAYNSNEIIISAEDLFEDPHDRFQNVVVGYATHSGGTSSPPGVIFGISNNNLPDNVVLQQNWTPGDPTIMHDLMVEVIERLANPSVVGGVFEDYYFDFTPDAVNTLTVDVNADLFGGIDSGVQIVSDALTVSQPAILREKTLVSDNTRYKNHCILICDASSGTLPMNNAKFSSYYEHGIVRPEWSASITYNQTGPQQGDLVMRTNLLSSDPNQVLRFFKCIGSNVQSSTPPESDTTDWIEDFSTSPTAASYIDFTPWTSSLSLFEINMAANVDNPVSGYSGFFYDWNITRANYDPTSAVDPSNQYLALSIKYVVRISNSPPAVEEQYHGMRILVGSSPTGAFIGNANRIAEWDAFTPGGVWQFSNPPTTGGPDNGDMINNLDDGTVRQWNGSSWVVIWGTDPVTHTDINYINGFSPFHICADIESITGATNVPNSAIEATYKWLDENAITGTGNVKNRSSRGAWLSFVFPYPRVNANGHTAGDVYGGGSSGQPPIQPYLDSNNLNYTSNGLVGWNIGTNSEDLGKITGIRFKMRLGIFNSTDDSTLVSFQANIPMIFWAVDIFDRVTYTTFQILRNNQWQLVTIPFGYNSNMNLYFSRWDELVEFGPYVLPWDFTLAQKEYTGVQFDWKFVKAWGVMMQQPYDLPSGFYTAAQDPGVNQLEQELLQGADYLYNTLVGNAVTAVTGAPVAINTLVDHTKIAIDELCFQKELIVNSSDFPITFPRSTVQYAETETDYLSAKSQAQGIATRLSFYPQFWHVISKGDVRMQFGKLFTLTGQRIPGGSLSLGCQTVKHIIDHKGYFMEVLGVRKFLLPAVSATPSSIKAGSLISIIGSSFTDSSTVNVNFDSTFLGSSTVSTFGGWALLVNIPGGATKGIHTITATDTTGNTATYMIQVN